MKNKYMKLQDVLNWFTSQGMPQIAQRFKHNFEGKTGTIHFSIIKSILFQEYGHGDDEYIWGKMKEDITIFN